MDAGRHPCSTALGAPACCRGLFLAPSSRNTTIRPAAKCQRNPKRKRRAYSGAGTVCGGAYRVPVTAIFRLYTALRAAMSSVRRSFPQNTRLSGRSGTRIKSIGLPVES